MCLLLAVAVGCGPSSKRPGSDAKLPVEPPVQAQSNSAAKPGFAPRSGVAFDLEATRVAALGGAAIAQIALADYYATSRQGSNGWAEALKWYRAAAEQGQARAQYNVALMYTQGLGAPRDYLEAAKWYQ